MGLWGDDVPTHRRPRRRLCLAGRSNPASEQKELAASLKAVWRAGGVGAAGHVAAGTG